MADITHILKGKFDRQDINEIMVALRATTLSSADRIHISLQGRRARINNRQFRNLSKRIALSGIALTEGALGTKQSEFLMSGVDVAAVSTTGITIASDGTLWVTDVAAAKVYHINNTGGAPISEFTFATFDASAGAVHGITIDPTGNLWIISGTTGKIYKTDQSGTLLDSFVIPNFISLSLLPQDISYSEIDDTLYYTDNRTNRIYNLDLDGNSIGSFEHPKQAGAFGTVTGLSEKNNKMWIVDSVFDLVQNITIGGKVIDEFAPSVFDVAATSNAAVTIASDGTLWIVDAATQKIYNVMGTDLRSWLGEGLIIHSDNGFNKRVNN